MLGPIKGLPGLLDQFIQLRVSGDETRLLNDCDIGNLMRLAIHSLSELNNSACDRLDWAYDNHTSEGKAKRAERNNYVKGVNK